MFFLFALFLPLIITTVCEASIKNTKYKYNQTDPSPKFDNPNYVKDRHKNEIFKPQMPDSFNERHRQPFNSAWMDYCDPYHCNDYHKNACGLNRKTMKFRWFQSQCHIMINNQCANYRGSLTFDVVDVKFCRIYVKYLRSGCPSTCDDDDDGEHPVCGISSANNDVVVFRSRCAMNMVNCRKQIQEFDEVKMSLCELTLLHKY